MGKVGDVILVKWVVCVVNGRSECTEECGFEWNCVCVCVCVCVLREYGGKWKD